MSDVNTSPRNKPPEQLAVIDADRCTGCGACVEVCPVDCIQEIQPDPSAPGLLGWCEIDWDRCIGCELCIRVPGNSGEPHTLTVCPWEAIEMVPLGQLVEAVERIGGSADYIQQNRPRLLQLARRQVELCSRQADDQRQSHVIS